MWHVGACISWRGRMSPCAPQDPNASRRCRLWMRLPRNARVRTHVCGCGCMGEGERERLRCTVRRRTRFCRAVSGRGGGEQVAMRHMPWHMQVACTGRGGRAERAERAHAGGPEQCAAAPSASAWWPRWHALPAQHATQRSPPSCGWPVQLASAAPVPEPFWSAMHGSQASPPSC